MDPGIGPFFTQTCGCLEFSVKMWKRQHLLYLHSSTKMHTQIFSIPPFPKIGLTHKNSPQWCRQLSQPTLLRAGKARLTGALSKGGKCAESPPTFICGKRRKNRRKPVIKNIPSSGVSYPNLVRGLLFDSMQPLIDRFEVLGTLCCTICEVRRRAGNQKEALLRNP